MIGKQFNTKPTLLAHYDIAEEDLPTDLQLVASVTGVDMISKLIHDLPGTQIYIPRISHITPFLMRYLSENRTKPHKQLSVELGVSEKFVKRLMYDVR
jgi:hypothetical protein